MGLTQASEIQTRRDLQHERVRTDGDLEGRTIFGPKGAIDPSFGIDPHDPEQRGDGEADKGEDEDMIASKFGLEQVRRSPRRWRNRSDQCHLPDLWDRGGWGGDGEDDSEDQITTSRDGEVNNSNEDR